MELWWIILSLTLIALGRADDSCPKPDQISPCTCDGEGLNCMRAKTLEEVRKAFKANFKYGGVRAIFIQGTPITSIPEDLFGNVKTQQFYVEVNNISSVSIDAFSASKKTLKILSFFGNRLSSLNYSQLNQYENLEALNLGRNKFTTIPNNAFSSQTLVAIIFAQNQISHIGMNAFSNVPNLARLELSMNSLTTLGPMSLAFKSHAAALQINLQANQISNISTSAFQGAEPYGIYFTQNQLTSLPYNTFGNLITRVGQKGGFIEVSGNPFSCRGCDYSWIVLNKEVLLPRFVGFTCTDGRTMNDLTKSGIGCY